MTTAARRTPQEPEDTLGRMLREMDEKAAQPRTPQEIGRANRAKGLRLERDTRKLLKEAGWLVLWSKDSSGAADLVAIPPCCDYEPDQSWAVQCKTTGYVAPAERTELLELADQYNLVPVVAYEHKEGRAAKVIRFKRLDGTEIEP